MELNNALSQIAEIRRQMARNELFRGYRSLTVGFSGVLALAAAAAQPYLVPTPREQLGAYLGLWTGVAALSALVAGAEMAWRLHVQASAVARQLSRLAAAQLLPSLCVGALLTLCLYRTAPESTWMLPGLWALLFSLGIFASVRLLPRPFALVAAYYGCAGLAALIFGQDQHALSPRWMALSFGIGQVLSAIILYFSLERSHAPQD